MLRTASTDLKANREAAAAEWNELSKARNAMLAKEVERIKAEALQRRRNIQEDYARIMVEPARSSAPERDVGSLLANFAQPSRPSGPAPWESRPRRESWSGRPVNLPGTLGMNNNSNSSGFGASRALSGSLDVLRRSTEDGVSPRGAASSASRPSPGGQGQPADKLGARVEALRLFLKEKLGRLQFQKVYQRLRSQNIQNSLLDDAGDVKRPLTEIERLVQQLIACEQQWEEQRVLREVAQEARRRRDEQKAKEAVDVNVMRKHRPFSGQVIYFGAT